MVQAHTDDIQCNDIFCSTSGTALIVRRLIIGTIVIGPMNFERKPMMPVNPKRGMTRTAMRQLPDI